MKPVPSWSLLAVLNALLPVGILLFAVGFFPYKPFLPGLAEFDDEAIREIAQNAPFDKVIFMVVDALRSDFVFASNSGFKFTQSLIENGAALPFTSHAAAPTVTMPRLKALTTGSIPSFLDLILNFAESDTTSILSNQDTWLAQIHKRGGKVIMFGDDTWLKLFPTSFERSDGTSSFFVADFTEVDNNVTRHITDELKNTNWDAMILHYLGMDHIGHKFGPQSQFMFPKQEEMDGIVREMYSAIENNPTLSSTLLVLCGDHGMNEAGNHGGSGPGESSPAMVFMSPKFKQLSRGLPSPTEAKNEYEFYSYIQQSDLVPSLAALLGFPIPRNNLGIVIKDLLPLWEGIARVEILASNARQLLVIATETFSDFFNRGNVPDCTSLVGGDEVACLWRAANTAYQGWKAGEVAGGLVEEAFYKFAKKCQRVLSTAASNYNLKFMTAGAMLVSIALIITGHVAFHRFSELGLSVLLPFNVVTILNAVIMFASSFIEEEQQYWYWISTGWFAVVAVKEQKSGGSGLRSLGILLLLRIIRRWNQTGQKFAGAPDIVRSFMSFHPNILWILILVTYSDLLRRLSMRAFRRIGSELAFVLSVAVITSNAAFKVSSAAQDSAELIPKWLRPIAIWLEGVPLLDQARAGFLSLAIGAVVAVVGLRDRKYTLNELTASNTFHDILTVFLATQSRFTDIPLLLFFNFQADLLNGIPNLTSLDYTVTILLFQRVSFFAFGGSNAISSVDLSNAYNGVSDYNALLVGLLTFISNWIGPIFWTSAGSIILFRRVKADGQKVYLNHALALTLFELASVLAVMVACTLLRTHLFIWTVFSPKYLYSMAWSIAHHIGITLLGGRFLVWANGKAEFQK